MSEKLSYKALAGPRRIAEIVKAARKNLYCNILGKEVDWVFMVAVTKDGQLHKAYVGNYNRFQFAFNLIKSVIEIDISTLDEEACNRWKRDLFGENE